MTIPKRCTIPSWILTIICFLVSATNVHAQNNSIADNLYYFRQAEAWLSSADSAGTGYRTLGNKFKASNAFGANANAIYSASSVNSDVTGATETLIIKAEGGATCSSMTVNDLLFSASSTDLQLNTLNIIFRNAAGAEVGNYSLTGNTVTLGMEDVFLGSFSTFSPVNNVAEIEFTWAFSNAAPKALYFRGIAVSNIASAPSLEPKTGYVTYKKLQPPKQIMPDAAAGDLNENWTGGNLIASITANGDTYDRLAVGPATGLIDDQGILYDGVTPIATITPADGWVNRSEQLSITFYSNVTNSIVQKIVNGLAFFNTSDQPLNAERQVTVTLSDNTGLSATVTRIIDVDDSNIPPVLDAPLTFTVDEYQTLTLTGFNFSDIDIAHGMISAILSVDAGTITVGDLAGITIAGNNTGTVTVTGKIDSVTHLFAAGLVKYIPLESEKLAITLTTILDDNGNSGVGGNLRDTALSVIHINPVSPVLTGISTSTISGLYGQGTAINFDITFDHPVTVGKGTPALLLPVRTNTAPALYQSGSGTNTLTFTYTVEAGDATPLLDYTGTDALLLNGGLINSSSSNTPALLTLPAPGSTGSIARQRAIIIDGVAPPAPLITYPLSNAVFNTHDLMVAGTSEPDAVVTIYLDGVQMISVTADGDGNWYASFTASRLTDGNHYLKATATDAAKNVSAYSASKMIVVDVTVPGLISASIYSDNRNKAFATTGNVVTVYFTVNDAIYLPQVVIAGQAATVRTVGKDEYVAEYTMTDTDTEGLIPFSINFTDLNGNSGGTIDVSTDNSKVYFDKERPAVTLTTIASSPVRTSFIVYISFSEAISDFDLSKLHVTNAVLSEITSISNNVMTVEVTPVYDGLVTMSLDEGAARDAAGNLSTASEVLQVEAAFGGYLEKIYPNPATSVMNLKFTG
ncbi:MAG TPA: Ig-like domain-containing protein, partial [Chitinophaga sp.]|nr:Ig-like domain-containing protein [Chitinophaga sp.]